MTHKLIDLQTTIVILLVLVLLTFALMLGLYLGHEIKTRIQAPDERASVVLVCVSYPTKQYGVPCHLKTSGTIQDAAQSHDTRLDYNPKGGHNGNYKKSKICDGCLRREAISVGNGSC